MNTQIEFESRDASVMFADLPKGTFFKRGGELMLKWREDCALSLNTQNTVSVQPKTPVLIVKKLVAHT